jgi:hypothetical protein
MHVSGRSRLSLLDFVIGKKRAHLLPKRERPKVLGHSHK